MAGLLGIFPRFCALCLALFLVHMTGFVNATNAEMEGGTTLIIALIILCLTNKGALYSRGTRIFTPLQSPEDNWPVKLFLICIGAFYTTAGLNKFLTSVTWPFVLNLEHLSESCLIKA
ncbi:MAG: hypothetical protein R3C68_10165 [Myxococcota bacterium]